MSAGVPYLGRVTVDDLGELTQADDGLPVRDHRREAAGDQILDTAAPAGWRVLWDIGLKFPDGDFAVPDRLAKG